MLKITEKATREPREEAPAKHSQYNNQENREQISREVLRLNRDLMLLNPFLLEVSFYMAFV